MRATPFIFLSMLAVAGCRDRVDEDETIGELGNGTFQYVCVEASDPMCPSGGRADDFPDRIGVDGLFELEYEAIDKDDLASTRIESVAPDVVDRRNERFLAVSPGTVAMLAKKTSNGRVQDIVHVSVVEVDGLRFEDEDGRSPRVIFRTGREERLRVVPLDDVRTVVAGARDFEWSVSHPDRVRLEVANPSSTMDLFPVAPGPVTVTVRTGDLTETLQITVEGSPIDAGALPDGGRPLEPDASPPTDAGTSTSDAGPVAPPDAAVAVPESGAPVSDGAVSSDGSTADAGDGG